MDEDELVVSSNESAQRILDWQLSTYHHIQNLAIGALGATFSILAIIGTLFAAFRNEIPSIPWSRVSQDGHSLAFLEWYIPPPIAGLELGVNWMIVLLGVSLAASVLMESIGFLGQVVSGERLEHIANNEDIEVVQIPEDSLSHVNLKDSVTSSRPDWIRDNAKSIDKADQRLKRGFYRVPVSFVLAASFISVYWFSVKVQILYILLFQVLILIFTAAGILLYASRNIEIELGQGTQIAWSALVLTSILGLVLLFL